MDTVSERVPLMYNADTRFSSSVVVVVVVHVVDVVVYSSSNSSSSSRTDRFVCGKLWLQY